VVKTNRRLTPYLLVGILTLGTGFAAGLGLATGPVTVIGTVTNAKPFCSGLSKVAEYVYHHQRDQDVQVQEMRLFDKTFSHTLIPTAIANPISAAIGASRRYLPVIDVVIAHHGSATNSQAKSAVAAFNVYSRNVRTIVVWSKTNCASSSFP
jgi:hypothetical protein